MCADFPTYEALALPSLARCDERSYGVAIDGLLGMSFLSRLEIQLSDAFVEVRTRGRNSAGRRQSYERLCPTGGVLDEIMKTQRQSSANTRPVTSNNATMTNSLGWK